jgi:hypothetical protein
VTTRWQDATIALVFGAALFAWSLTSPDIAGGDDAYRHVRFAHTLATDFRTALADPWHIRYLWPKPVDVWFGYHLLLAPFTLLLPLIVAAKLTGILVWTATVYTLARFLRDLNVCWPYAWLTLAIFGSGLVLFRVLLVRPFLLSVLLTIVTARLIVREQAPWKFAVTSALHAFSYSLFFFVSLPVVLWTALTRKSLVPLAASLVGLVIGLAASPFFPENFKFATAAIFSVNASPDALQSGGELRPISAPLLLASLPILGLWLAALAAALRQRLNTHQQLLLTLSVVTLLASLRAQRFFDYFVPFAALFAATTLSPFIEQRPRAARKLLITVFVLCALSIIPVGIASREAPSVDRYRAASAFLATQPNAIVFNTAWQQYPFLYFFNPRAQYLTGMEPGLFHAADAKRYATWRTYADDASPDLATLADFKATHILIDRVRTPKLLDQLRAHSGFRQTFDDGQFTIFAPGRASDK